MEQTVQKLYLRKYQKQQQYDKVTNVAVVIAVVYCYDMKNTFCLLNVCENVLTPSTTAVIDRR